jgi:CHAT domain-containing protein/Tfp pilus assembly protein PilF
MNQPLMVAQVLSHLGDVAMARGDLIAYQDYFTRALKIYEQHKPDSWEVANLRNNLGLTAYSFGDLEAAQHYYTGALKIFEQLNPDSMEVAMCLNNLGALLVDRGESEKGRKYLTHASEIYKQQSPTSWQFASNLSNLGYMALRSNDLTRAQDDFNRALAIHEQLSPNSLDVASRLSDLGMVAAKRRDLAAAKDYYNRALEIFQRLDHGSLNFALLLDNMGDVAFDERRFSDALDHFTRAVKIVETYRRKILSPDIRAFFVAQNTELYRRLLRTHLALNDVPAAFATLERARARSLVDMLAERRMDFSADAPKELLQRQRELDAKRTFAYNQLGQLDPDKDSKEIEALRADINDIAIKQRQLVTEIRSAHPKYATLQYPEPLDLKGVQQALNEGTLLLAYSVDEDETYLFAVTKTNLQLYPLKVSDKELHERVKTFRSALAEQKDFVEDACQLYDWLIRPAQAQVDKAQRVLICPDGPLYTLPFAALVKGEIEKLGNEGNGRGRRYFVEMKPLHTIVSMTVYAELRKQSSSFNTPTLQHSNTPTLLALGDPAYDATPETVKQDFRKRGGKKLTRLPNTRKEVEAITNLYGKQASKYLSKEANETVAKQESGKAKILHFACHGVLDNFDPLASALALTPDGKKEDGMLRAYEVIQNMRLNADLVVLSACETGLGKETKNEGIVGLTRAFQYAGAKSVVVSLWNVADVSTTPLMTEFYRQLKSSQSKDEALQAAQLALLRGRDYKHPSHWAAFVLVGDWK